MPTIQEYASHARAAYKSNKPNNGETPLRGWIEPVGPGGRAYLYRNEDVNSLLANGFEGRTFVNPQSKEVVIAFAGTSSFEFNSLVKL